jgi:16S rRNA (cytidine1402-2'-O)-methyltransferase
MPGTLFVVATPIGNLEDITLRALRVLREVAVVAAEDTRRSGNLLRHYQINTPLISVHEHNEHQRSKGLVERLLLGDSVALVTDAGTPGISDPGALVVRAARDAGIRVEPVPGPSAVTAVLSASGLSFERFAFAGFPPVKAKDRKVWFSWVQRLPDAPVVCYEAPHRIERTLRDIRTLLADRPIIIAREVTKAHEEWLEGQQDPVARGEFVIVIGQSPDKMSTHAVCYSGADAVAEVSAPSDEAIASMFGELTKSNVLESRKAGIRAVADRLGLSTKAVYAALERAKN